MTPKRFAELARSAFVQAAAQTSKLRNGKVNHSRVAAQTGLTRADVKRLLRDPVVGSAHHDHTAVERVINGWRTDREFVTQTGRPRSLQISGPRRSFVSLVRKHGGDVPHRAVLDELRRIGAVRHCDDVVQLHSSAQLRHRHNFAFLSPVLPALVDGLRIASRSTGANGLPSIQRLNLSAEGDVDSAIVRNRCISSARSMLYGLAHSSLPVTVRRRGKKPASLFTVTVLVAENRERVIQRTR